MNRAGDQLHLAPQLPSDWPGFTLDYRYGETVYTVSVEAGEHESMTLDGVAQQGRTVAMVDDGRAHSVLLQVVRSVYQAGAGGALTPGV